MVNYPQRWGWIEIFILIQYLSSGMLLLPGTQSLRFLIRLLPYASSFAMLLFYLGRRRLHPKPVWAGWVTLTLLLLALELLHPETVLKAGFAQCLFQFFIVAPVFWADKAVKEPLHLNRILWLIFLANAANAVVGALQVYYPATFMPKTISHRLAEDYIADLTYVGAQGREIMRPPGLTDLPGGAAIGGAVAGFLGIIFSAQAGRKLFSRLFCLAMACVAIFTLYLTHVRVFFLAMIIAFMVMAALRFIRGRILESGWIGMISILLILGAFVWATKVGGEPVAERFLSLKQEGAVKSFEASRWHFLEYTFKNLLFQYPLGAGLGRWGMMSDYFGSGSSHLHVEVQITGWLFDGGVLMWLFYLGAILAAMGHVYHLAVKYRGRTLAFSAGVIFCINLFILATTLAGPSFNTMLGIQFWLLNGILYGAACGELSRIQK